MKHLLIILSNLIILLINVPFSSAQAKPASRPNIVVIFADDMGYSDLGCFGGEISTPNIDQLAVHGVRLTDFHNQARCCPSRAVLMTGRYPHQVGVGAMIDGYDKWIRDEANSAAYQDHLSTDSPTVAELLRGAGYHTIMCGKWHLGAKPDEWPCTRGFDRSFVLIPGAMNYYGGETTGPRTPMALDDKPFVPPHDGFYSTDEFTNHAIEFLKEAKKDQPFFLYMAYNAPHWPLQAPEDEIAKYKGKYDGGWQAIREKRFAKMVELGIVSKDNGMSPMDRGVKVKPWNELTADQRKEWATRMEVYAAQITREDENVGRLLAALKANGQMDNTLVLFISDNGGAAEDPHRGVPGAPLGTRDSFWGYARPWATVSNTPWRYHKTTAYEGGTSTPFIAYWPGVIPAAAEGTMVRQPGHLLDLLPTFLDLAGAKYPTTESRHLEGEDILPMIEGKPGNPDRTYCWEHEGHRAIRKGNWKLVMLPNSADGWELYDLSKDRIESHDLAAEYPEKAKELQAEYDAWAKRCGVVPWKKIEAERDAKKGK